MRIDGAIQESSSDHSPTDDMLETEQESVRERVCDLEKKVLEQGDEIVCLRSTLADVLRRLAQLEGTRNAPTSLRVTQNNHASLQSGSLRYRSTNNSPESREAVRRVQSCTPTSLPQRRGVHYQSTGSLHSDSPSSSSVSPPPTPVPRGGNPTTNGGYHHHHHHHIYQTGTPVTNGSSSGRGNLTKRWSSTGDFQNHHPSTPVTPTHSSRLTAKSLFNLHMRPQQNNGPVLKHGTRDAVYNEEEGTLKMYLRGRPVILYAPSDLISNYDVTKVAAPPQQRLKLEWVYGYRGRDCRSNLYLLPTGEMLYFVAAVVVLYNVEEQNQRHYLGHTDDVKCMSIHPNKMLVATGQVAGHDSREGRPHVRVWNSVSLATLAVIGLGDFQGSVCCLSFSKADGGTLLCAVDEANDHNISVWDWQKGEKGQKITETKCSVDTVVAAEFHPLDRGCIVTCGKGHVSFWSLDAAGALYKRMGVFANRDKPKYVTCLAFTQTGDVLTGDSNGNIIVWPRGTNTISRIITKVHEGPIFTLCVLKEGSVVSGGGKDGIIKQLDPDLQPSGYETRLAPHVGGVRTVTEGRGSQLLVGSTRNCVLAGSLELGFSSVVMGHTEELWALAAHPSLQQFITSAWDCIIQLWDAVARSVVWSKDIGEQSQSATFSPDGQTVVVGCVSGKWLLMDADSREVTASHTDGNEPIQVVSFSPNGELLALGSRDNNIYVYQVGDTPRRYNRIGRCTGHSSFITHLDWATDSQHLRSNSGDYEILYWNAGLCRQVTQSSKMRDIEWATHNCTLSFTSVGIWPETADGTDVNACCVSNSKSLMATADDFAKVKLYTFPTIQPKSVCHTYSGHSSHVTNVTFLSDDTRLISIGGKDTSVLQWRVV
ncbi:echinoderm microtubule-associated protein-like 2 isoform X3 [Rhodnius prolixus]